MINVLLAVCHSPTGFESKKDIGARTTLSKAYAKITRLIKHGMLLHQLTEWSKKVVSNLIVEFVGNLHNHGHEGEVSREKEHQGGRDENAKNE